MAPRQVHRQGIVLADLGDHVSTPAAVLVLLVAVWLVSMTFFGGLAHKLSQAA